MGDIFSIWKVKAANILYNYWVNTLLEGFFSWICMLERQEQCATATTYLKFLLAMAFYQYSGFSFCMKTRQIMGLTNDMPQFLFTGIVSVHLAIG